MQRREGTTLPSRPVFVVDFDGTLVEDRWPMMGDWLPGAVDAMKELLRHGRVKVFSSRLNPYQYGFDGEELMTRPAIEVEWDTASIRCVLDDKGLHEVEIHTTPGKPSGDFYIDNLAVEFKGDWDEVLDRVLGRDPKAPTIPAPARWTGRMREFDTGATRDTDTDKLAYAGFFSPLVLRERAKYMHRHRVQSDGNLRAANNWQKGIPLEAYMDSGFRHFMSWWLNHQGHDGGESLKEALCALAFNVDGYLFELLKAEDAA